MADYTTSVDIANRALQLCGASRITALTDNSKNAAAVSFAYDKVRRAELRRRPWKFAIRKAILRAIDSNTLLLAGTPSVGAGQTYAGPTTVHLYSATTSYGVGELVYLTGVPLVVYMCTTPDNAVAPPGAGWTLLGGGVTTAAFTLYEPLESPARFLFRRPANFLRYAPDPKFGAWGALGGPAGNSYDDLSFEREFVTSSSPSAFLFRFIADITDVTQMDPMFCEGLACRIALAVVEELTQSSTKLSVLAQQYKTFMSEAGIVNAIEVGPTEPVEDDYISVRR